MTRVHLVLAAAALIPAPSGTFGQAPSFTLSASPTLTSPTTSIAAADFNLDGTPDLAVGHGTNAVSVLDGAAGWLNAWMYPNGGVGGINHPNGMTAANLDGNSMPELVVANGLSGTIMVFTNTGSVGGPFSFAAPIILPVGGDPYRITTADVDLDGRRDIICANKVAVLCILHNGIGVGFTPTNLGTAIAVPSGNPVDPVIGEFSGDSFPDIACACSGPSTCSVAFLIHQGTPPGIFPYASAATFTLAACGASIPLPPGGQVFSAAPADVDGNGSLDLSVVINGSSGGVIWFPRTGPSTFGAPILLATLPDPHYVRAEDVDCNGLIDLVVGRLSGVTVLQNNGGAAFTPLHLLAPNAPPTFHHPLVVTDLYGNGRLDIAVCQESAGVDIWCNSSATPPLPGTGDDIQLTVGVNGILAGPCGIGAAAGSSVVLTVGSAGGTFTNTGPLFLIGELFTGPLPTPLAPGLHFGAGAFIILGPLCTPVFPALPPLQCVVPPNGLVLGMLTPSGLTGWKLLIQSGVASPLAANGQYAASNALVVRFL